MYVAKIASENLFFNVTIFEKTWSEEMLSNNIVELDSKRFLSYFLANYWINKKIASLLINNKELEIING